MKIAILTESFLPHMNGVTGSVLQAITHLSARGHELLVIAPDAGPVDLELSGARIELLRSIPLPGYPAVRIVSATATRLAKILHDFKPDVVHLASPFILGWAGVRAAHMLRLPTVAVYQTDVAAYAGRYGIPQATSVAAAHIAKLHRRASLTLVPSTSAHEFLIGLGVDRLRHWGRGVDADRFAPERRDETWRDGIGRGQVLVGYAGRLSPEKQVEDLAVLQSLPGVKLVVIGEGPSRASLEQQLPEAHFTGFLSGDELARALASLDVFVHPGESETFCQGVQEALASGTAVVATGSGGPLDLVENSVTGWLYEPGNLEQLRSYVADLTGDRSKREAFARSARRSVRHRSWAALCEQLEGHYTEAIELRRIDDGMLTRPQVRPRNAPQPQLPSNALAPVWRDYVALGDSITEGLGDSSRVPKGEYRGWAARFGMLLAQGSARDGIRFANLAVRSRRVEHLAAQVDRALELKPDLASVLMGSNDLLLARVDIAAVAAELERQIARLRGAGVEVLLGTPFLPRRATARMIAKRFGEYNAHVRRIALHHGCHLLDIDTIPEVGDLEMWSEDRVHLASAGHRVLAYRAATILSVPHAEVLGTLDRALHDDDFGGDGRTVTWLRAHALPWAWRRLRGRTAGDGLSAPHDDYVALTMRPTPSGI